MRHTFYWWTTQQKHNSSGSQAGRTFGLDRADLDFGGRWADQEFLMRRIHSGTPVRFSFRFLHGSISEFMHCAKHWDMAKVGAPEPRQEDIDKVYNVTGKRPPSPSHDKQELNGTIRPSDYAVWATKHQKPIEGNSAQFETWMSDWKTQNITTPDIVILTQGWGGVPRAEELDSVKYIVQSNPETLFIWSPMYVTDHGEKRYQTYVQTEAFNWTEPNLRMLDLWDMAQHLPNPKSGLVHIPVGGSYMTQAMGRFWSAVKCH